MFGNDFFTNRDIPYVYTERVEALLEPGEKPLFALAADLDLTAKYCETAMIVTDRRLFCFDPGHPKGLLIKTWNKVDAFKVDRMYGNAEFFVTEQGRDIPVLRFTFSVAVLAEAAAVFLTNVKSGKNRASELEACKASFDKLKTRCPKCGRILSRPGAECFYCKGKKHVMAKLLAYVKPYYGMLALCILLALISTAATMVPPYLTKILVDDIIPGGKINSLTYVVISLLVIYLVSYSIGALRGHLMRVTSDKLLTEVRNDVYRKAQFLPMNFYDKTSIGSIISRIGNDVDNLKNFMLRISQEAVVQFCTMIGIIAIMFSMNVKLTLLSLAPIPLVVIGTRIFSKKINPVYRRIWRRWSSVNSVLSDSLPGIRVVKSFSNEERAIKNFEAYNGRWLHEDMKASAVINIFPAAVNFFTACGSLLIWAFGGRWVIQSPGKISLGLLVSFISYASMFYNPVNFFANLNDSYQSAMTSAERLFDIIDAEPEPDLGKGNLPANIKGRFEFRHVNFSFDKSKKVLDEINFVIEPGDIVGIVGTTGSGKSTLINLILRFYDDYEGEILLDGTNIRNIDLDSYRNSIGYVQQEPMMFRDTVYNNISYGSPDATVEDVIRAADIANAHTFIEKLPDAYDTMLGERGTGLSGGERQRVSIARAVLKNPSILIFDEATASVDSETEHLIQEAIERLISGRTTIMIAHRLSTLSKANKIIVVDNGEIVEFGTREELMRKKGKYYSLVEMQSMGDREMSELLH